MPALIERVDLSTGVRTRVRALMPPDRAGVIGVLPGPILNDGQGYSYGYWRSLSRAVVVTGITMGQ